MCVIISVIKRKNVREISNPEGGLPSSLQENVQVERFLTEQIHNAGKYNQDGVGVVGFNFKDGETVGYREMGITKEKIGEMLNNTSAISFHFRYGTSGQKNLDNVHYWNYKGWFFAHNGMISNLSKHAEMSDSLKFFHLLAEKNCFGEKGRINVKLVDKIIKETTFWGRIVLVNPEYKKMFFFGDFKTYLVNNNYLVISTTELDFSENVEFMGLDFEVGHPFNVLKRDMDGTFGFARKRFKEYEGVDIYDKTKAYYDKYYNDEDGYGYKPDTPKLSFGKKEWDKRVNDESIRKLEEGWKTA